MKLNELRDKAYQCAISHGWHEEKHSNEHFSLLSLYATDAKIVISSSWRKNTVEDTKNYLTTIGHFVPFLFPYADRIIGVTIRAYAYVMQGIRLSIPRGVEIKQWIDTHIHSDNGKDCGYKEIGVDFNYVILDDDSDMLLEQAEHFIKTDTYLGLSEEDVKQAIKILNE